MRRAITFLILALLCAPLAVVLTLVSWQAWGWIEAATGIESLGHSGPASWCYVFVYAVLLGLLCAFALLAPRRRGE